MLIIFDMDGTLVRGIEGVEIPNRVDQQEMIPGVVEKCAQLRAEGHTLCCASNQGGVSFGLSTLHEAAERVRWTAEQIGAIRSICSLYHAKGKVTVGQLHMIDVLDVKIAATPFYRKPAPGMLLWLMLQREQIAPNTLFVGDRAEDQEAALNAGVSFQWAKDFFEWQS